MNRTTDESLDKPFVVYKERIPEREYDWIDELVGKRHYPVEEMSENNDCSEDDCPYKPNGVMCWRLVNKDSL